MAYPPTPPLGRSPGPRVLLQHVHHYLGQTKSPVIGQKGWYRGWWSHGGQKIQRCKKLTKGGSYPPEGLEQRLGKDHLICLLGWMTLIIAYHLQARKKFSRSSAPSPELVRHQIHLGHPPESGYNLFLISFSPGKLCQYIISLAIRSVFLQSPGHLPCCGLSPPDLTQKTNGS